ncbi:hypothetical protein SE17_03985 [Kouleothrix aurantiaca]|mgnify:CR=1 FL=1|uniref:Uncharacterized protein n=1 Tax=Kouleothrix aurantiaca TaxID=186479 RepID=A0A0P9DWH8_9CHLR|nr:hypothetical protein SE17_03985 [Kouleothrix aurantiaca]
MIQVTLSRSDLDRLDQIIAHVAAAAWPDCADARGDLDRLDQIIAQFQVDSKEASASANAIPR